jgi:hypothetical protein
MPRLRLVSILRTDQVIPAVESGGLEAARWYSPRIAWRTDGGICGHG